jgi:hypothetical protein
MGVYLSTPKTDKLSENGENDRLKFGLSSMQGWRATMEDAVSFLIKAINIILFALAGVKLRSPIDYPVHEGCNFVMSGALRLVGQPFRISTFGGRMSNIFLGYS